MKTVAAVLLALSISSGMVFPSNAQACDCESGAKCTGTKCEHMSKKSKKSKLKCNCGKSEGHHHSDGAAEAGKPEEKPTQ